MKKYKAIIYDLDGTVLKKKLVKIGHLNKS